MFSVPFDGRASKTEAEKEKKNDNREEGSLCNACRKSFAQWMSYHQRILNDTPDDKFAANVSSFSYLRYFFFVSYLSWWISKVIVDRRLEWSDVRLSQRNALSIHIKVVKLLKDEHKSQVKRGKKGRENERNISKKKLVVKRGKEREEDKTVIFTGSEEERQAMQVVYALPITNTHSELPVKKCDTYSRGILNFWWNIVYRVKRRHEGQKVSFQVNNRVTFICIFFVSSPFPSPFTSLSFILILP